MGSLEILDSDQMGWTSGLEMIAAMNPAYLGNLGPEDLLEETYSRWSQKTLFRDEESTGRIDLIRLHPGFSDLTHAYHDSVEECFVLEGGLHIEGEGPMDSGDYFWRPPGFVHSAHTEEGFLGLLMLEGVSPGDGSGPGTRRIRPAEDLGRNVLHADDDAANGPRGWVRRLESSLLPWIPGRAFVRGDDSAAVDLGRMSVKVLSKNWTTGAQSLLIRLEPGYNDPGEGMVTARQRVFVVSGKLRVADREVGQGGFMVRHPNEVAPPLSSDQGSVLFVKTDRCS